MRTVRVPLELAHGLLGYLHERPYGEVALLIQALSSLPVDDGTLTTGDAAGNVTAETLMQAKKAVAIPKGGRVKP